METLLKNLIAKTIAKDFLWTHIYSRIIRVANFIDYLRTKDREKRDLNYGIDIDNEVKELAPVLIRSISPNLVVLNGPFAGMQYPASASIGSAFASKIIGSYERELHCIIEQLVHKNYSEIVDIGCAEGYYAVGLARLMPSAKVYAFDTDNRAVELCAQMAALNQVSDRVFPGESCDAEHLTSIPFRDKALIVCDCEGCERSIFTPELVQTLAKHDFLIETHDFLEKPTSGAIEDAFKRTHFITRIQSIDDVSKASKYRYKELDPYGFDERRLLLAEYRPCTMHWYFMTPIDNFDK